jgi:hypothetical protein
MKQYLTRISLLVFFVLFIIAATAAGAFWWQNNESGAKVTSLQNQVASLEAVTSAYTATATNTATPTTSGSSTSASASVNPTTCYQQSPNGWLVLNTPCQNAVLTSTFVVKGVGFGAFEGNLNYEIRDSSGKVVVMGYLTVQAPDLGVPGNINSPISWDPRLAKTATGSFHLFMMSANDGSKQNELVIPVRFQP